MSVVRSAPDWLPKCIRLDTTNGSDTSFTALEKFMYEPVGFYLAYTTSANAGDRQVVVEVRDHANELCQCVIAPLTQAASITYSYYFGVGSSESEALRYNSQIISLPLIIIKDNWTIRVYDANAVDTVSDDLVTNMYYMIRKYRP